VGDGGPGVGRRAVVPWRLVLQHIPIRVSPNGARSALRTFRLVGYRPGSVRSSKDEEVELVHGSCVASSSSHHEFIA
jgi:hypothetical protein